jgi:HSP20 family molecular chaperone IbpA
MKQPHVHVITNDDTVIVKGTFPEVTLKNVTVTDTTVILVGEHLGHKFVQEFPLDTVVEYEHAVVVFDNGSLTIIMPRGDTHGMV